MDDRTGLYREQWDSSNMMTDLFRFVFDILFSELHKIIVNKATFLVFRGEIVPRGSAPGSEWNLNEGFSKLVSSSIIFDKLDEHFSWEKMSFIWMKQKKVCFKRDRLLVFACQSLALKIFLISVIDSPSNVVVDNVNQSSVSLTWNTVRGMIVQLIFCSCSWYLS